MSDEKHLLFYDSNCALCLKSVAHIRKIDHDHIFRYEPLSGQLAEKELTSHLMSLNSLVLIENNKTFGKRVWIRGRGALRILWLIGGWWKFLGVFCFLPFGADLIYRFVAKHRHLLS